MNHMQPTRRLRDCVERWPAARTGDYDPRCCRFPKSCSATVYDDDLIDDADLEPSGETVTVHQQLPAFPNPFTDDPDADRPMGSLWTVVAWATAAALALGGAVLAYQRLERARR